MISIRSKRTLIFVFTVISVNFFSSPSQASEGYKASVLAVPLAEGLDRETATIFYALESVVRQSHRVNFVDIALKAEGGVAEQRDNSYNTGRQLYERGVAAYSEFDFTQALYSLEDAVKAYEQADLTRSFPALLEAHAMKSAAQYFNGDVRGAERTMRTILSLRSNYVFDPAFFPPDTREVAERIRSEIEQESRNPLEVIVEQVNARVYVNGVFRGISPIEMRDLAPAEHYISLVALGREMLQEKHIAGPGSLMRVNMNRAADLNTIGPMIKNLENRLVNGVVSEPSAVIARWVGVEEILAAGVKRAGGGRLRVIMARVAADGHVLAVGDYELAINDPGALSALTVEASKLYVEDFPRGLAGEPVPKELKISPLIDRITVGYAIGGAGIVAGMGGLVVGLQASKAAQEAKSIPQRRQAEIINAVDSAKRKALVADILYGTALLGTVAGIILAMPAFKPEKTEPSGRGLREDWFTLTPVPLNDGFALSVEGRFK